MKETIEKSIKIPKRGMKALAFLLVTSILSGLVSFQGIGSVGLTDKNQVVNQGETLYYHANGQPADSNNYAVSVSKTISQAKDEADQLLENQFTVDLSVETATNYESIKANEDAAVLFVIDLSYSMKDECAECGRKVLPQTGSQIRHPYYSVPAHCSKFVADQDGGRCLLIILA